MSRVAIQAPGRPWAPPSARRHQRYEQRRAGGAGTACAAIASDPLAITEVGAATVTTDRTDLCCRLTWRHLPLSIFATRVDKRESRWMQLLTVTAYYLHHTAASQPTTQKLPTASDTGTRCSKTRLRGRRKRSLSHAACAVMLRRRLAGCAHIVHSEEVWHTRSCMAATTERRFECKRTIYPVLIARAA